MTDGRIFCLDTSAFINPWNHYYAPDLTPGYWRDLSRLVSDRKVIVSEEVREELERIEDSLRDWARLNIAVWHPLSDPVQDVVTNIMATWGKLVDSRKDRSRADPFVIATAKVTGSVVVTGEQHGTEKKPQIPFVCEHLDVPWLDVYAFVREAGIQLV